jgi:hypothetical protein
MHLRIVLAVIPAVLAPLVLDASASAQDGRQRVEWCGAEWRWLQEAGAAAGAIAGGCPTNGQCDTPSVRDGFIPDASTPIKVIRLRFVVLSEDDGSSPAATVNDIAGQVAQMNADYLPYRVQFAYTTAFVDDSTYRRLSPAEESAMKNLYAAQPDIQCNVFVTDLRYDSFVGFGTFPWSSDPLGAPGGIIIDETVFGHGQQVMTHEAGHCLGLWHSFHGVTEQENANFPCFADEDPCDCPCYETAAPFDGDTTGDFCGDTPPTPINYDCVPPGGIDPCSDTNWGPTQPENFMGYSGPPCWSLFTDHQAGRMHCWIEDVLSSWVVAGCPGTGGCYNANGTPGCTDPECCAAVCAIDPYCCDTAWDSTCANEADTECGPINNDCEDAGNLAGNVSLPFSTINATTDGPPHPWCQKTGDLQVGQDIWYSYTALCDGFLTVSVCGTADYDTKLAIYQDGAECPVTDGDLLACDDDTPGCPDNTSELTVEARNGGVYLVRLGGFLNETGSGTLSFFCQPHCGNPDAGSCFEMSGWRGCDDAACCQTVCATDPYCCEDQWDNICVDEALSLCWHCGPGSGNCWEANGTPGCNSTDCCQTVCAADAFCCENQWDSLCADGAASLCGPPPTSGACCESTGVCSMRAEITCLLMGGDFQGIGTTCADVNCSLLPTGACCLPDGTCSDGASQVGCFILGGTYQGNGTSCAEVHCGPTTGACCFFDGSCSAETESDCSGLGGVFQGLGVDCAEISCILIQTGACCFDDGSCLETTIVGCVFQGGTYQGNGTNCAGVVCPIDACPGTGTCCEPNSTPGCDDEDCCEAVCAVDAYCCDTLWDALCAGEAEGLCATLCPVCPWDIDGDGAVGITDFLALLGAWGPNPGHPADFDGDGEVGITDFLALLANWGPCL